jgi:hypothetical protein
MDFPRGTILLDDYGSVEVINASDVPNGDLFTGLERQDRVLSNALAQWVQHTRPPALYGQLGAASYNGSSAPTRQGTIVNRDKYLIPTRPYDQMRLARQALDDDVVSGAADVSEALAFSNMSIFAEDADEEDVYNQVAAKVELDARLKEIWRELFTVSQCYVAVWWSRQTFKVRGTTAEGNARRRSYSIVAPEGMTVLDPLKVVPVGSQLFGKEQLAYVPSSQEALAIDAALTGQTADPMIRKLIVGRYKPGTVSELGELSQLGIDGSELFLLDPMAVFRHTLTRPSYDRLAQVRLKSVFPLLDMKEQLRQEERAHLIGAANFVLLVRKGTDQMPARQEEISHLESQVRMVGSVPILIGDHRLNVEIITPRTDNTLRAERWNTIDGRITARCYGMFVLGNYPAGAASDDSAKLVKVIARGMESRRHMIRRTLERHILDPLFERNESLTTRPKLQFHPRSIALDFDAAYASFILTLRENNDLSRETMLNQWDLDQDLEAELRTREREEGYDDIFKTQVAFSSPNPVNAPPRPGEPPQPPQQQTPPPPPPQPGTNRTGRRNGGGAAPGTGQGQPPRRVPRRAERATNAAVAAEEIEALRAQLDALAERLAEGDDDA